ncbi:MAG: hypothetical protein LBT71_07995 [Azoarcus sp.]|jgi:hypothetical protein|nr:hypothetical protein [Azoarcus sp.]
MLVRLRRTARNTFGILSPFSFQALITLVSLRVYSYWGLLLALWACIVISLYAWWRTLARARAILHTPTSLIASAAQGYSELRGRGLPLAGKPLLSPVTYLPLLWFRLETYTRDNRGKWRFSNVTESDTSFMLDDGSGLCAVDPEGAEMLVRHRETFTQGDVRYVQWSLLEHAPIYVLGDFATLGSINPEFDMTAQMRELLECWKTDKKELLRRFDLDGNGTIDAREWELARAQARREVLRQRNEILTAPEAHIMRRPAHGLYLISDLDPDKLARRHRLIAALHALVFIGIAAALAWLYQLGALPA